MQVKKQDDKDADSLLNMCDALTGAQVNDICDRRSCNVLIFLNQFLQVLKLLQLITPVHEYEERVPSRFLGIIKGKITKNSGALQRDVSHISPPDFPYVPSAVLLTELELPSEVTKFAQLV